MLALEPLGGRSRSLAVRAGHGLLGQALEVLGALLGLLGGPSRAQLQGVRAGRDEGRPRLALTPRPHFSLWPT